MRLYELDLSEDINIKQCFCRDETPESCPPKGTFDLYRCAGVPMIASLPHFYHSEELLEKIESGLHPNKHDHGIEILLEKVSSLANIYCYVQKCTIFSDF